MKQSSKTLQKLAWGENTHGFSIFIFQKYGKSYIILGQFIKHKLITILLDGKLQHIIALQLYFFNNIESIHIFLQK